MQITSTRTLLFRVKGQKDYILRPSLRPVFAPEFIRDTALFQLALKDDSIQEFAPKRAQAPADDAKAAADKAAADSAKAKAESDKVAAADKAKADAEAKVAAEIESAKASLVANDKKAK
jgi:hypothetical protein